MKIVQEQEYIKNINKLDLVYILKNEKVTFDFAINYLLNEKHQKDREEKEITIDLVYCYQPHLREEINKFMES